MGSTNSTFLIMWLCRLCSHIGGTWNGGRHTVSAPYALARVPWPGHWMGPYKLQGGFAREKPPFPDWLGGLPGGLAPRRLSWISRPDQPAKPTPVSSPQSPLNPTTSLRCGSAAAQDLPWRAQTRRGEGRKAGTSQALKRPKWKGGLVRTNSAALH